MNDWVLAVSGFQEELIAGGYFTSADGHPANHIARWDGDAWYPMAQGLDGAVRAIVEYQGNVIAAGTFETSGGNYMGHVARWNGVAWEPMALGLNDSVNSLLVFNGELFAGGNFWFAPDDSEKGGHLVGSLTRWDGSSWQPAEYDPYGNVLSLAEWNGKLVVLSGEPDYTVTLWDGDNWVQLPEFTPLDRVKSVASANGELIVSGAFYLSSFGSSMHYAKRWSGTTWEAMGAPSTNPSDGSNTQITANIACGFQNSIFVGGNFKMAGPLFSARFARLAPTGPAPTITQHPSSPSICQGSTISLRSTAIGDGTLSYQWRKNGVDLPDDEDTFGTQSNTLVFAHAAASDAGPYECIVKLNNCTQATSNTATLSVFPTNTADGNLDGHTDARDIAVFVDALVNFAPVSAPLCAYDLTSEGIVNPDDIPPFVTRLLAE